MRRECRIETGFRMKRIKSGPEKPARAYGIPFALMRFARLCNRRPAAVQVDFLSFSRQPGAFAFRDICQFKNFMSMLGKPYGISEAVKSQESEKRHIKPVFAD